MQAQIQEQPDMAGGGEERNGITLWCKKYGMVITCYAGDCIREGWCQSGDDTENNPNKPKKR